MEAARRAGIAAAVMVTTVNVATAAARVSGSCEETPYNIATTKRAVKKERQCAERKSPHIAS